VTGIRQQGERVRDNAIESFAHDIGEVEGNADRKSFAEIRRDMMMPADAVMM
jgi:hypothetical protein